MGTQVILLLIVFASSVVGTLLNPQPWAKKCIVAFSAASAIAAMYKAYEEKKDTDFIKGALAAELASSKPTPAFQRAFVRSLNRVADSKGLRIYNQMLQDEGTLVLLVTQHTDARAGAVRFNLDSLGQAYVKFVSKRVMDGVLKNAMYTVPALKDKDAMADIMEELGFVGKIAVGQAAPWLSLGAQFNRNFQYDPPEVRVDVTDGPHVIRTHLSKEFVASILSFPPYARNWKAYEEFQRQVPPMKSSPLNAPVSAWMPH